MRSQCLNIRRRERAAASASISPWIVGLLVVACGGSPFSGDNGRSPGTDGGAGSKPQGGSDSGTAGSGAAGRGNPSGGGSAGTLADGGGTAGAVDEGGLSGVPGIPPMVCDPGAAQCSDREHQICKQNGSGWTSTACDFVCDAQEGCLGECGPGMNRCKGQKSEACDETGTWIATTTCPFVCDGDGVCSGECQPGSQQCSGNDAQRCDDTGKWKTLEACQLTCNVSGGTASCGGACKNGSQQCSGKTPQTCSSSEWMSGSACPFVCEDGTCTGECVPGSQKCGMQGGVQTCSARGVWLAEGSPCPFTCLSGTCGGVCVPSAACADDGNPCTDDVCNAQGTACTHPNETNGAACGSSSSSACDAADSCLDGTCQANPKPAGTACTNDNNACTTDACNGFGACTHTAAAAATVCRAASCANGVLTAQSTCGGSTTCPASTTSECYGACNEAAIACETPPPTKVDDGEVLALDSDATYLYSSVRIGTTSQIVRYTKSSNTKMVLFETTDPNDYLSSLLVADNYVYFSRIAPDNMMGKVWMIQTNGVKQAGLQVSSDATFGFAKNSTRVYWSTARRYTCVCSSPATINVYSVAIGDTAVTKYTRNFNGMEMSPDIEVDDQNLYVWEMSIQMNGPQVSQVYSPYLMAYSLADHQVWTQIQGSYFIESGVTYNLTGTNSTFPGITKQGSTIYGNANLAIINSPMSISMDNLIFKYTGATTRLTRKSPVGLSRKFAADASNVYIENMRIPVSGGSMSYWTNHQLGDITLDASSVYFMSFGYWNQMPYQGSLDVMQSALMRLSK